MASDVDFPYSIVSRNVQWSRIRELPTIERLRVISRAFRCTRFSMPAETTIEQLPISVSFADIERIAERIEAMESLTIDLGQFRRTRLFGEGALLGLVALARNRGKELFVQLGSDMPSFDG